MTIDLGTIIAGLHDSEINGAVSWVYNDVWTVQLGDAVNGVTAEAVVGNAQEAKLHSICLAHSIDFYRSSSHARRANPTPKFDAFPKTTNTGFRCSPDMVEWLGKRTMFGGIDDAGLLLSQRTGCGGAAALSPRRERACVPAGSGDRQPARRDGA